MSQTTLKKLTHKAYVYYQSISILLIHFIHKKNMSQEPIMTEDSNESGTSQSFTPMTKPSEDTPSYLGLAIGILIVLLALVLIGLYMWSQLMVATPPEAVPNTTRPTAEENNEPESTTAEAQAETLQIVSTSDELSAIEADLSATNLDDLDAELNAIDAELNAELQ